MKTNRALSNALHVLGLILVGLIIWLLAGCSNAAEPGEPAATLPDEPTATVAPLVSAPPERDITQQRTQVGDENPAPTLAPTQAPTLASSLQDVIAARATLTPTVVAPSPTPEPAAPEVKIWSNTVVAKNGEVVQITAVAPKEAVSVKINGQALQAGDDGLYRTQDTLNWEEKDRFESWGRSYIVEVTMPNGDVLEDETEIWLQNSGHTSASDARPPHSYRNWKLSVYSDNGQWTHVNGRLEVKLTWDFDTLGVNQDVALRTYLRDSGTGHFIRHTSQELPGEYIIKTGDKSGVIIVSAAWYEGLNPDNVFIGVESVDGQTLHGWLLLERTEPTNKSETWLWNPDNKSGREFATTCRTVSLEDCSH